MVKWAHSGLEDGVYRGGETAYAIILADSMGVPFIGGEPGDGVVVQSLLDQGYSYQDLLGFYFLRQVPQYLRAGRLGDEEEQFAGFISSLREEMKVPASLEFSYSDFLGWYQERNLEPFNPDMASDAVKPLADGEYFTQRLSAQVGKVRDRFILETVAQTLEKHDRVAIVYGSGHLVTQRKALETYLGAPVAQSKHWD